MTTRARKPPAGKRTIGVLADWLEGNYQSAVVGGAVEAARGAGISIVLLADSMPRSTFRFGERHNVVYDLGRSEAIDGLVVMAAPVGANLGLEDLAGYCERYRPRPMCSIGAHLAGMTGILVDGLPAFREAIRHLVEQHGYRRIAFVGGPGGNVDARDRLVTFRETMTGLGLPPDPSYVTSGDFRYETGVEAIRLLVDERGLEPDAVIAASDSIALGAVDGLRSRGLHTPRDVAVVGFDDISEARYSIPPLTTIRQPLRQQGRLAVEVLLRRLAGERVADDIVLPAEFIVRRSCGCYSQAGRLMAAQATGEAGTTTGVSVEESVELARPRIVQAMHEAVSGLAEGFPENWADTLLDALIAGLATPTPALADRVRLIIQDTMRAGARGNPWQPALAALRRELMPCLESDPRARSRAEDQLQEAQILVEEAGEDIEVHQRLMIERRRRSLSEATELLSAAFDLESLGDALRRSLPRLGVPSASLVLDHEVSAQGARVIFAHDPGRDPAELQALLEARIEGTSMPRGLLPSDRVFTLVVEPLFFKDEPLGYAVFEMRPGDTFVYDAFGALRVRLSGALKVALLIEELQIRAGQLRQAQKMETLGQLAGGIAHDFNNLLQAIRGYAELAAMAEPGTSELSADLEEIVRAADRASQLTRQLLTFSQPTRANARVVDVNDCVRETIPLIERLLGPTIEISVVLGSDAGNVVIDPTQLEQALVNLCVNSRDAMPDGGSVVIETGRRDAGLGIRSGVTVLAPEAGLAPSPDGSMTFISVSDTGGGIAPEIKERIFEPFFTTKEAGQGTGLGLSIVYGIVRGASGEISVESEPDRGSRFVLTFPTSPAAEDAILTGDARPVTGTETVLLVEDEPAIRKLAQRVLADAGYNVLTAANGVQARELWSANEGSVDLLLSDVTMPGMSGIAFAAELASCARPPRTLFISGRLPGDPKGPNLPPGADFLPKPFSVSALLDAVRATLDAPAGTERGRSS